MENVTLSIKNCHRAKTVRMKEFPENGNYEFGFRGHTLGNGYFCHLAKKEGHENVVKDSDLQNYIVVDWKYQENFEDMYDLAVRAFYNTSHTPEVRALQYIRGYEADLQSDLAELPKEWHFEYIARFRSRIEDLFRLHSRCLSAMITGPARFPTKRAQSASNSYDKAVDDFMQWRKSYHKRAERAAEAAKTPEEKMASEWRPLKKDIIQTAASIFAIDTENYPAHRALFVSSIYGKLERIALNGKAELLKMALALIEELSAGMVEKGGKPVFTKRHKVWKLPELCEAKKTKTEEMANREDTEIPFEGGQVVKCYSDDRLRIYHDEKPSQVIIDKLKSNGFRWSPSNGCWQRQLTDNAYYAAARVLVSNEASSDEHRAYVVKLRNAK